jgi:serine protease Do
VKKWLAYPLVLSSLAVLALAVTPARPDESHSKVVDEVNLKLVKLFGVGGIRGLASYGTGIIISPTGRILTINSHMLDTRDLRIHMPDGTRYHGKVIAREPELDVALVQIDTGSRKLELEHWFNILDAAKKPTLEPGTNILAFSNQYKIAERDEPLSAQRGVISSYSRLLGRIGIFEAAYRGNVYVIDAITNNPGSGGGIITTRKGEPVAMIGKELRNELTNTWINYAIPFNASVEITDPKTGKKTTVSVIDLVVKGPDYKPLPPRPKVTTVAYHGIILVPNVVERTPPYIEEVVPGSPADKAKLKADDLIVYVDGLPVPDINTFNNVLAGYGPGAEIKLEIQRGDKLTTVPITLAKPAEKKPVK